MSAPPLNPSCESEVVRELRTYKVTICLTFLCCIKIWIKKKKVVAHHKFCNVPQMMGLPDHVPSLWQTLSLVVVFSACPLLSSQTKQALEPVVVAL